MTGGNARAGVGWPPGPGEMAALIRGNDWASSPLGPPAGWPAALRAYVDLMLPVPTAMGALWGPELALIYNDACRALVGSQHPAALGRPCRDGWPALWQAHGALCEATLAGEACLAADRMLAVPHAGADDEAGFELNFSPLRGDDGAVKGVLLTAVGAGRQQKRLQAELQHRVRNTLAVIRSIASRSAATSESVEDYAMHLDGRIGAISRSVTAAARVARGAGIDLATLVADELLAASAQEGQKLALEGPDVRLPAETVEAFGLAIHELATNAIKFGALAHSGGRIRITWRVQRAGEETTLAFDWKETGLIPAECPGRRRGFGTELLERMLPYQLSARTKQHFEPDGLRCIIELPLPSGSSDTEEGFPRSGATAPRSNTREPGGS